MKENKTSNTMTDFGYENIPEHEKARRVADVFDSVANNYDLMNDVMSLGVHRLWKQFAIEMSGVRPGQKVLDIASGTCDLVARFARIVGDKGRVTATDINGSMLSHGRDKMIDSGHAGNVGYVLADAECLPFPDNEFDCVTVAFGLRNVTRKKVALASIYRVLKPGGRVLVLEFSKPTTSLLKKIYDSYSFNVLPKMGKLIAKDEDSYRYLAESIRMHPDQRTLKAMMETAGFELCDIHNLTGGIVALHRGYKL